MSDIFIFKLFIYHFQTFHFDNVGHFPFSNFQTSVQFGIQILRNTKIFTLFTLSNKI
jgi:hypothetical protein